MENELSKGNGQLLEALVALEVLDPPGIIFPIILGKRKIAAENILPTIIIIFVYSDPKVLNFMAPKKSPILKGGTKRQKEWVIGTDERTPFPLKTSGTNLVTASVIQGNDLTIIFIIL
jgi:hypothetical protein